MERTITPEMSPFKKFQFGDRVAHISMGDGVVTLNNGEYILVKFQRGNVTAEFDAGWFANYPRYLFHRGTVPASLN